jgi:hypothetical protein
MDATMRTRLFALGRVAFGVAFVTAPGRTAATWIGGDAQGDGTKVMTTAMGARDAAIGAGLLATAGTAAARPWLLAGLAADTADLVATLRAGSTLPTAAQVSVAAIAGGAIAGGIWLLAQD